MRAIYKFARLSQLLGLAIALTLTCSVPSFAQDTTAIAGNHPATAETEAPVGVRAADAQLTMAVTLQLRDRAGADRLLAQLQDPQSANYHHWLTSAEFAARFMPKMVLLMPTLVLMTLAAGFQLALREGNLAPGNPNHAWLIVSYCVVGVMAVIALGVLEPANITVLVEMRKQRPDGEVIALLMRRFIYTAGITGLMQVATLIIMTRVATQ